MWLDAFEGQAFYPELKAAGIDKGGQSDVRLDVDRFRVLRVPASKTLIAARVPDPSQLRLYRVRFVGREAQNMACGVDDENDRSNATAIRVCSMA